MAMLVLGEGAQLGPPVLPGIARHAEEQRIVEWVLGRYESVLAEHGVIALQQCDKRHVQMLGSRVVRLG